MKGPSSETELSAQDVLYLISIGRTDINFTDDQLAEAEEILMEFQASKIAGGDHMVHWEASEMCH